MNTNNTNTTYAIRRRTGLLAGAWRCYVPGTQNETYSRTNNKLARVVMYADRRSAERALARCGTATKDVIVTIINGVPQR